MAEFTGTTKAEIEEVLKDTDCFIRHAISNVESFMPTGLGPHFQDEYEMILVELRSANARFRSAIKRAQRRHQWAAK